MSYTSPSSGNTYVITNAASGTALDLKDDGVVIGYGRHGEDNQQWEVEQQESGKWTFKNKRFDLYLAVEGGDAGDGAQVIAQEYPYEWYMNADENLSEEGFRIHAHPNFNIDLDNGSAEDGARVSTWGQWTEEQGTAPHQSWRFEEA